MLREIANAKQVPGESRRRWFYCNELDLVVFEDASGICGFQLAYDKHWNEHSLAWRRETGYRHYVVDDGESVPGTNETPFLYPDGAFMRDRVLAKFVALCAEMPADVAAFVVARLREFDATAAG